LKDPKTVRVDVGWPGLHWEIHARAELQVSTSANGQYTLGYGTSQKSHGDNGIIWTFSTDGLGGQLAIVQIWNSGLYTYVDSNDVGHSMLENAPFPLLDIGSARTVPWYQSAASNPVPGNDSPWFNIPLKANPPEGAGMALSVTDYVMYNGGGGYVPVANFSWSFSVLVNLMGAKPTWEVYSRPEISGGVTKSLAYPPPWNGVTYQYLTAWTPPQS
jgi:hypothetical protein